MHKLGDTIYVDVTTHDPSTGGISDADSTPTCEVFEDDNDTAIHTPTVTKRTAKTGDYRTAIVATSGNGFENGKKYNAVWTATVNSVTAKCVYTFTLETKRMSDLNDLAAGAEMGLANDAITAAKIAAGAIGSSEAPLLANLDATITSRASQASVDTIDDLVDDLEARLTAARAGYLDNLSGGAVPTLTQIEASTVLAKQVELLRALGLAQENQYIDQVVYTSSKVTSMRLRIYSDAGSVGSGSNVVATYTITAQYTGDNLDWYKVVKE
jgi:hypothetical protein